MTGRLGGPLRGAGTWTEAARAALDAGLERPRLWPFALLAFLLRGGWFVVVLPIVVVPSPLGIATFIGPTAVTPAGPSPSLVGLIAGGVIAAAAWLLVGGLVAAAAEAALIATSLAGAPFIAGAPLLADLPRPTLRFAALSVAARMLRARLLAAVPLGAALGWGIPLAAGATYAELVTPTDPAIPLPFRVLADVPLVVVLVLTAWLAGELIGGIAVRRVVLLGEGALAADVRAVGHVARRPASSLATVAMTLLGSGAIAVPALVFATLTWERVAWVTRADADPVAVALLTLVFVAVWASGLVLLGATAAWRSLAWTVEVLRADRGSADRLRHERAGASVKASV